MVFPSLGHVGAWQVIRQRNDKPGIGMNPDPFAPVDIGSPFRIDHVLDFLTNLALCVTFTVIATSAALVC